jgi:hypothetical protein
MKNRINRPIGRFFYWPILIAMMAMMSAGSAMAAGPAKTTVQDTVYRADGSVAQGTLLISWPAFTSAAGDAVAAGSMNVKIAASGAVSIALVPNTGSMPASSYKVTLRTNDGVVSEEYWTVPATGTTTIGAIRSKVLPGVVAQQFVARDYLDTKLAQLQSSGPSDSVLLSGSYTDPAWLTSLSAAKITGALPEQTIPATIAHKDLANTWTASQTDGALHTFNAGIASTSINGRVNAFLATGADFGAKVNAAIAAAPSGAVIDGTQFNGTTAWTTQIVIAKPIRLELCGVNATFTGAAIANGLIVINPGGDGTVIESVCPSGRQAQVTRLTVAPSSGTQNIISIGTDSAAHILQHITVRGLAISANANVRDFVVQNSCGTQHVIAENNLEGPATGGYTTGYVYRSACSNPMAENDSHRITDNMVHRWGRGVLDGVSSATWRLSGNRWLNLAGAALSVSKSSNLTVDGDAFNYANEANADSAAIVLTGSAFGVNNVRITNSHFENDGGAAGTGYDVLVDTTAGFGTVKIDNNRFYAGQSNKSAKAIVAIGAGVRSGQILRNEFDSQTACAMDLTANYVALAVEDNQVMNSDRTTTKFCGAGAGDAGKHIDGQLVVENTPAGGAAISAPNNRSWQLKDAAGTNRAWLLPGGDNYLRFYPLAATGFIFRNFADSANRLVIDDASGQVNTYGAVDSAGGYRVNGVALAASHLSNGVSGSGATVLATSPTLTSPNIGVASGTSLDLGKVTLSSAGTVTKYNNVTTKGAGVGAIFGSVSLTAQSAAISATNLYTAAAGLYRVCYDVQVTRVATTSSSVGVTIGWNNGSAQTKSSTAVATNVLNAEDGNCYVVSSTAANITYAASYSSSGGTSMQYALRVTAEQLQ